MSVSSAQAYKRYKINLKDGTNLQLTVDTARGRLPRGTDALPNTFSVAHGNHDFWGEADGPERYVFGVDKTL